MWRLEMGGSCHTLEATKCDKGSGTVTVEL